MKKSMNLQLFLRRNVAGGHSVQKHCMSINHLVTITDDRNFVSKFFRKKFGLYSTF